MENEFQAIPVRQLRNVNVNIIGTDQSGVEKALQLTNSCAAMPGVTINLVCVNDPDAGAANPGAGGIRINVITMGDN